MSSNKKRIMTVYYGHHSNSYKRHPVIRLAGEYLSNVDFKIGDKIEISMEINCIVINKVPKKQFEA